MRGLISIPEMQTREFGRLPSGEPIESYRLSGSGGAFLEVITYGGIVTTLNMPDRDGHLADVVLGFDRLELYLDEHPFFGAITGRVAGRIPGGKFTLEGTACELVKNDGSNHLHGGLRGLDKRVWTAQRNERADGADSIRLTYESPDREEGYPGRAFFCLDYTLTQDNVFMIESEVTTDRVTPICLANHSYFNLAGEGSGNIFDHEITVFSNQALCVDERMTPLGRAMPVGGTAADFSTPRRLGDAIPHLFQRHGDCYVLPGGDMLYRAAELRDPASGRTLSVSTNEHCLQVYTSAYLDCASTGKSGRPYHPFAGLCLECQGYSAGVDFPEFGNIVVKPDHPQRRVTHYAFSTQ